MLLIAFLVGCTGGDDTGEPIVGSATAGEALYAACASCHGVDGAGTEAYPSLIEEIPEKSDAEITDIVLNGTGSMAGYPDFDDQDIADLLAYLRATFG